MERGSSRRSKANTPNLDHRCRCMRPWLQRARLHRGSRRRLGCERTPGSMGPCVTTIVVVMDEMRRMTDDARSWRAYEICMVRPYP
jgi:hypothetical protein